MAAEDGRESSALFFLRTVDDSVFLSTVNSRLTSSVKFFTNSSCSASVRLLTTTQPQTHVVLLNVQSSVLELGAGHVWSSDVDGACVYDDVVDDVVDVVVSEIEVVETAEVCDAVVSTVAVEAEVGEVKVDDVVVVICVVVKGNDVDVLVSDVVEVKSTKVIIVFKVMLILLTTFHMKLYTSNSENQCSVL